MNDPSLVEIFLGGGWVLGLLILGIAWYGFGWLLVWAAEQLKKRLS